MTGTRPGALRRRAPRRPSRALARVTAALPTARPGPARPTWPRPSARAVEQGRHLVVQAGTGTGKSLAYLVPAVLSGRTTVVATATKALQDQLATKDLPFLAEHLGEDFAWAVLKGRSNYLCLQRVREIARSGGRPAGAGRPAAVGQAEVERLASWAASTTTGDRAELDWSPSERAWASVSVSSEECPGATRCPLGEPCFAEAARRRAAAADVVVVNTHLYGIDVGAGGVLLPEHDVVVIDEAHQLEDITSDTTGLAVGAGRFTNLARLARRILDDPPLVAAVLDAGTSLSAALVPVLGQLLPAPLPDAPAQCLIEGRLAIDDAPRRPAVHPDRRGRGRPAPDPGAEGRGHAGRRRRRRAGDARRPRGVGGRQPPRAPGSRWRRSTWRRCCARASGRSAPPSSPPPPCRSTCPVRVGLPLDGDGPARRRQPVRLRGRRPPLLRRAPARPSPARPPAGRSTTSWRR